MNPTGSANHEAIIAVPQTLAKESPTKQKKLVSSVVGPDPYHLSKDSGKFKKKMQYFKVFNAFTTGYLLDNIFYQWQKKCPERIRDAWIRNKVFRTGGSASEINIYGSATLLERQ